MKYILFLLLILSVVSCSPPKRVVVSHEGLGVEVVENCQCSKSMELSWYMGNGGFDINIYWLVDQCKNKLRNYAGDLGATHIVYTDWKPIYHQGRFLSGVTVYATLYFCGSDI